MKKQTTKKQKAENLNMPLQPSLHVAVVSGSLLDKSLLFKRAWRTYKIKLKHNCKANFGHELANCYRIARLIGYENYRPSGYELIYR